MHKYIKRGISFVLVAAVAGGGFYTYRHIKSKENMSRNMPDMENTLTTKVDKGSIVNTITATGTVMLNDEVEVYAEGETNKILEFHVEEGDTVTAGQLLVTYDTEDSVEELENKIRDTQREIENAELSLKSIQTPASDSEIKKLENEVTNSQNSITEAQNTLKTIQTNIEAQQTEIEITKQDWQEAEKTVSNNKALLEVGGITQEEYDSSLISCSKAKQSYDNAVNSLESLNIELETAKSNIAKQQDSLALAQASLDETVNKLDLEENQIKIQQQQLSLEGLQDTLSDANKDLADIVYSTYSTVNGVVTEVCVDEGTYTEENTVMLKVADLNDLIVSANIEEYDAPLLEVGQKVTMTSDGLEGKTYTGKITEINPTASTASSNMGSETVVPIEISVDNPDGVLKANYTLDLEIVTTDSQDVLCIPAAAIGTDSKTNESYVYKVENNSLVKTTVEVGQTDDTNTEIISGLTQGEEIISALSDSIQDGMSFDEFKAQTQARTQNNSDEEENADDRNRQSEQMVPSGGFGGPSAGGGMPPGGGR